MSDKDRFPEMEEEERPRVKVTDRRRVRQDGDAETRQAAEAENQQATEAAQQATEASPSDLEVAQKQAAEYLDHLQRLKAEFDNYRKRVIKEQTRAMETAAEPFVRSLLEVLDEFDLALMSAESRPDFEKFLHGVELVYAKLQEILRSEGVERIDAMGKPFDPEQHEALLQTGSPEGEPFVADVLRQGYTLKGRVIRPAGVKVVRR